jgi:PhoH-like ATPase
MPQRTRYVLDTNVILYDPQAILAFPGEHAEIIVPISVIEEIDQFKGEMTETGRNARVASGLIDGYRQSGNLAQGVAQPNGSRFRVVIWQGEEDHFPRELDLRRAANRVLATALQIGRQDTVHTVLVTQDTNLRIKANALGIEAIAYEGGEKREVHELYTGYTVQKVVGRQMEEYRGRDWVEVEGRFPPNHSLIVQDDKDTQRYLVFRYDARRGMFHPVRDLSKGVWDVQPRNPQQAIALELLMDPAISIVTLIGKAGTGKTLLALAAGLQAMMEDNTYAKMLVSRPIFPMGRDVGYLPGTLEEKLQPWMQPIFDNLEFLISTPVSRHSQVKGYEALIDQGLINIEPLTYIRGRSIPKQFMIVDESQNLTPHEIKTIITRVGTGTKIVLTGDPYQIDNPYVDAVSNGLSHLVERFRDQDMAGHVTLVRGERSALAEMAANIL